MCLIIHKPASLIVPSQDLWASYESNSDAWGVMYVSKGRVHVQKGLGDVTELSGALAEIGNRQCVIHQRYATHGAKNLDMAHPFEILNHDKHGRDIWLMHNGVLSDHGRAAPNGKSDTWVLVQLLRHDLLENPDLMLDQKWLAALGKSIGVGNKLVFMDSLGRVSFANKESGNMRYGLWYSNTYSLVSRAHVAPYGFKPLGSSKGLSKTWDIESAFESFGDKSESTGYRFKDSDWDKEPELLGDESDDLEGEYWTLAWDELNSADLEKMPIRDIESLCEESPEHAARLMCELIDRLWEAGLESKAA